MILPHEIKRIAAQNRIDPGIIEKDYVLSKILYGLSCNKSFSDSFVFKGGTALKKLFYDDWRYSEDLDFTLVNPLTPHDIKQIFTSAKYMCKTAFNLDLAVKDLTWPKDITDGQYPGFVGLKIYYDGPLRKTSGQRNNVRVDLTLDEPIFDKVETMNLILSYPDDIKAKIEAYSPNELLAEKMRSILERGKSRDYYDVWALLKLHSKDFDLRKTKDILLKKCEHKQIEFSGIEDFLTDEKIEKARNFWKRGLAHQLDDLPRIETVMGELAKLLEQFDL